MPRAKRTGKEKGGVFIHLGGKINRAFDLAGRNSPVAVAARAATPAGPFSAGIELAGRIALSGPLGNGDIAIHDRPEATDAGGSPVASRKDVVVRKDSRVAVRRFSDGAGCLGQPKTPRPLR